MHSLPINYSSYYPELTLIKLLDLHLAHKIEEGLEKSSIKNETSQQKNIIEFLQINKLLHLNSNETDESFFDEVAHYLKSKKKHKPVHVARHLRMITETLRWAK